MILRKRIYHLLFTIATVLLVIVTLKLSARYSISQYLEQKEIYVTGSAYDSDGKLNAGCAVPYSQLGWIITGLKYTEDVNEIGLTPSQLDNLSVTIREESRSNLELYLNSEGKLSQGSSMIVVELTVLDMQANDFDVEPIESQYVLPADFLKLADKYNLDSFLKPTLPIAVIRGGQLADMKHMYFPPESTEDIKMVFALDGKLSSKNGCLFSSVVPTQTVSVCIELSDYIY